MSTDKLDKIFYKQKMLQETLKADTTTQEYKTYMILALIDELTETLRETPWKPWKKQQTLNEVAFKEELADCLHFFINLCLSVKMTPDELYQLYSTKNYINDGRHVDGY